MKEKYKEIFSDVDLHPMLGAARYMLQLALQKEKAIKLQDEIMNVEYPFTVADRQFSKVVFIYASDLVEVLTCEGLEAERVFRCYLRDVIEATKEKQLEILEETFSSRTAILCKIIRNLKASAEYRLWESEDDEIIDEILSELCVDSYLMDYFSDELLDEFDEDLDAEEPEREENPKEKQK